MDLKIKTDEELNEMMRAEIAAGGGGENPKLVAILAEKNERRRKAGMEQFQADMIKMRRR